MKATVELIKAGIAEAENELKGIDKKRDAVMLKIKELRHDMVLLSCGGRTEAQAPPAKRREVHSKVALRDKGEQVGTVNGGSYGTHPIFKNVRVEVLATITSRIPAGEWFKASIIYPAISQFYAHTISKYARIYLLFLGQLKFVERNGEMGSARKYKWTPRFQNQSLTEEEVKQRIEDDRRALADVSG
jgi:hypothetical protein